MRISYFVAVGQQAIGVIFEKKWALHPEKQVKIVGWKCSTVCFPSPVFQIKIDEDIS